MHQVLRHGTSEEASLAICLLRPDYLGGVNFPAVFWIKRNNQQLLWIPLDYDPRYFDGSDSIYNKIGIGGVPGRVWIIGFDS